jgi:hypothetical protein
VRCGLIIGPAAQHEGAAIAIPKSSYLSGKKTGRVRPRSWDLGRSGSISRLREPLDRAADQDGVSAHSRDDPSRGRRGTLSPSQTSVVHADQPSPRRRRLCALDRRAPERRSFIPGARVIGSARVRAPSFARVLRGGVSDPRMPLLWPRWRALSPHSFVHHVAGVASAATRACAVPPLRSGPSPRSGAPLQRVPPAPACHDLHVAGGEQVSAGTT